MLQCHEKRMSHSWTRKRVRKKKAPRRFQRDTGEVRQMNKRKVEIDGEMVRAPR